MNKIEDENYKNIAIGRRLSQVREFFRETQVQFAQRLGISRGTMIKYEKGERKIDLIVLTHLHSLSIDINWLLGGNGDSVKMPKVEYDKNDNTTNIDKDTTQSIKALNIALDEVREFISGIENDVYSLNDRIKKRCEKEGILFKKPII